MKNQILYEFSEALKKCPWYNKIFEKYPVIMLHISGSYLYEVTDERSDWDLVAICDTDNIIEYDPEYFFTWKDIKVHWSWLPLKFYLNGSAETILQNSGLSYFNHIRDEVIIYKNPAYIKIIDFLIANKNQISYNGSICFAKQVKDYINDICNKGTLNQDQYSKILMHLCRTYYDLSGEPYDINFLRSIKRIRWQPVSDEYKKQAVIILQKLKNLLGWS